MKKIKWMTGLLVLSFIVTMLSACAKSAETVKVTIYNGSISTVTNTDADNTVEQILKESGIAVGENDRVTPPLTSVWKTAGADAIRVEHTAKVTVTDGTTEKTVELTGGTVEQAISQAGFTTKGYKADADLNAPVTDGMTITLKRIEGGFVYDGDNAYYYEDGELVTDSIVGSEEEGYFYANSEGLIDMGYCDGVTVDGEKWIVINGKARQPEDESDEVLFLACQAAAQCTNSSMSKNEKLRAAFDYIKTAYLEGVRHDPPYKELDWPIIYAQDIYVYGKGDCFSYGAAFAYMGKALGCSDCYACNSGGHGWAEIEGLVYDPEWDMHYPEYDHFAVDYDNNDTDVNYKRGIEPGADYMHVAV